RSGRPTGLPSCAARPGRPEAVLQRSVGQVLIRWDGLEPSQPAGRGAFATEIMASFFWTNRATITLTHESNRQSFDFHTRCHSLRSWFFNTRPNARLEQIERAPDQCLHCRRVEHRGRASARVEDS